MKILVTGGAGYIGSHTVRRLIEHDYSPVILDNLSTGNLRSVTEGVPFYQGNINDKELVRRILVDEEITAVLHFAASAYVGESITNPIKYYANNVSSTISLTETLLENGVTKFVFSSSCATYGIPNASPITEETQQCPINPYGQTKLDVESFLGNLCKYSKFRATALRYFNAAGAAINGENGEEHNPETHLIPLVLRSILNPDKPISIFGDDYDTPDGTCIRDYTHVEDLAEAHCLALRNLSDETPWKFYNLGTGQGYSILEIIDMAERVSGQKAHYTLSERRPGDPDSLIADCSKAGKELNWCPKHSSLYTIMESAWNWETR